MAALDYYRIGYADRVHMATISSSSEEIGYPDDNVADLNRQTFHRPNGTGWQYLIFDFGSAQTPTMWAILNHTLKTCGISSVQLKVGSTDNGSTWDTVVHDWNPVAEASDIEKFIIISGHTKRYWMMTANVVSVHPRYGVVFIGHEAKLDEFENPEDVTEDYGVAHGETAGGHADAEQVGQYRKTVRPTARGMSTTQRELLQTINIFQRDGLKPVCFVDIGEDEAGGECMYARIYGPFRYRRSLEANVVELLVRQEI